MISEPGYITNYSFPKEKATPYFQFAINDIRDSSAYYNMPSHAHTHAYYELFLVERGGGVHVIDDVSYPLSDRSVHILQPGVPHYVQRTKHTRGYVVVFTLDVLAGDHNIITESLVNFFRGTLAQPAAVLSSRCFIELKTLVQLMKSHEATGNTLSAERHSYIRSLFAAMLLTLKPNFSISHASDHDDMLALTNRFHELVNKYYHEGLPVADYAAKLGTTEKTLSRALKKHGNSTPAKAIRDRVILEAIRLLQHTSYSVKEIAYYLHFSDPAHFIKVFRQEKDCTPLEYRRMQVPGMIMI